MQFAFYILLLKLEFLLKGAKKEKGNQIEPSALFISYETFQNVQSI